jgi:membrane protein DedA with SNARE-associated domain
MNVDLLLHTYGYPALLLGAMVEGETIVMTGGFLARTGHLQLHWVMMLAFFGAWAGDQFYFHAGRKAGARLLERGARLQRGAEKVRRALQKHETLVVVGFRFLYGARIATPIVLGMGGFPPLRFFILNGVGALLWSATIASAGYFFGYVFEALLQDVKKYEMVIGLGILMSSLVVWLILKVRARRRRDQG